MSATFSILTVITKHRFMKPNMKNVFATLDMFMKQPLKQKKTSQIGAREEFQIPQTILEQREKMIWSEVKWHPPTRPSACSHHGLTLQRDKAGSWFFFCSPYFHYQQNEIFLDLLHKTVINSRICNLSRFFLLLLTWVYWSSE